MIMINYEQINPRQIPEIAFQQVMRFARKKVKEEEELRKKLKNLDYDKQFFY